MAHNVFISYSSKDKTTAEGVCSALESNNIHCWIAPRDITPGIPFAEAIIDAICCSKVFVLIFSSNSNISQQVSKEVERAVHHGIPIIPLRIEDTPMSKQLEYYTSNIHWLDAFVPPFEPHILKLCEVIQMILSQNLVKDEGIKETGSPDTAKAHTSWTFNLKASEYAPSQTPTQIPDQNIVDTESHKTTLSVSQEKPLESNNFINKPKKRKIIVVALIIVLFCIITFVLWILFDSSQPTPPPVDFVKTGYELMETKDYERAKDNFSRALVINSRDYDAQIGLATILYKQKKTDEALIALHRAIDLNGKDSFPYLMLGEIYLNRNEINVAKQYYQNYLSLAPKGSTEYNEVKQIIESMGNKSTPIVVTTQKADNASKEIEKYDPTAIIQAGIDAYNNGDYALCKRQMEEVLQKESKNTLALQYIHESNKKLNELVQSNLKLGKEAFDNGNFQECINFLNKALQIDPENEQSKKLMNLAHTNLSSQQIGMLVHQYARSVESNKLLNFYEKNCTPKVYDETKKDVVMMLRTYKSLKVEVADLSIRYVGKDRADVSFSSQMTGVQINEDKWQDLSKGIQKWGMVREKEEWKIENINFN
jgi:tetratricopeptide (TPR) repeat protein